MSNYFNHKINEVIKETCRELRKESTPAEKKIWKCLRNKLLENRKFYRQYPIMYEGNVKDSFFIADFFCFEEKLIIELDGKIHNYTKKYDEERTNILNNLGYKVIRFENDEVMNNLQEVLKVIKMHFNYK